MLDSARLSGLLVWALADNDRACGFYDQSSFTRQFRSVLGLTPGAYRSIG